jgi:predicted Zn-dependent peptidase
MLSDLCYKVHPYRWPTIGKTIDHVINAKLEDVRQFYSRYYGPNNAILSIAGPADPAEVLERVKYRFENIPARPVERRLRPEEAAQTQPRILQDEGNYPSSVLYLAWLMDDRQGKNYYALDLLSDVMSLGRSAVFYQRMVKVLKVCAHMDAYITGTADQGLFLMELRPAKNVSMEEMESTLWAELGQFQKEEILPSILQKLKNKNESTICFSNVSAANKATNIAYYESLGDAHLINTEADRIAEVTAADIHRVANMLRQDNVNIMRLLRSGKEDESIAMNQFEEEEEDE